MPKVYFKKTLTFIILSELLSLFAFLVPQFMPLAFWIIAGLFLIISLYKIEWGLYLLLAELFIGSKGYFFSYEAGGTIISIRLALFLIFMAVWLAKTTANAQMVTKLKNLYANNKKFIIYYLLFIIFISIGLIQGLTRHRSFNDVFFDFNAWLYLALFIPFLDIINSQKIINNIMQIFTAAFIWTATKTLIVFYLFGHQFFNIVPFYKWLRDSGVGEMTVMSGNFYRVFFQSQIYVLIGFFVLFINLLVYWLSKNKKDVMISGVNDNYRTNLFLFFCFLVFLLSCLIISFSRSFWVGFTGGISVLFLYLKFKQKLSWLKTFQTAGIILTVFAISLGLIFCITKLPPQMTNGQLFASLVEERVSQSSQEPGGSSRINLLKPLLQENLKYPIFGAGFGATVTYQSNDLRIKTNLNPEGWYTTYAFEWGYLDTMLKMGLLGLTVYLIFIYLVAREGFYACNMEHVTCNNLSIINYQLLIINGLLFGIIALLITNIFSPYLNHPLGIGYILLCAAIFSQKTNGDS